MKDKNHEKELKEATEKIVPEPKTEAKVETKAEEPMQSKEQEVQELTELLKRTQANFENYRKQVEKRIEEYQQFATKDLLLQLLPLLDNFELALKASSQNVEDLRKGVEMIYAQLFKMLENQGLEMIPCCGKFDPYFHEALIKEESDKSEGTILEELQKGFTLNGKVIRHAKVKISTNKK
ncbi:MAG: nucleotide exchange factor GrpE [Candidatus Woesearchaeota archaeon]